jgi:two-component system, cell cycle response regulator DivK
MKILLVEDNELNRDMLRRRLERHKHAVVTAEDGAQGVRLALDEPFDVVLMDLELPIVDGWEAIAQIKAAREVPIVVLSGFALSETRQRAFEVGCADFLTKPLDFQHLLEVLSRVRSPQVQP